MASKTFSGQLDQAMNEAAAEGNKILFIPQQTVGEVLPGAASELVVESDGTYSIKLAYNTYSIYHYSDVTKRKTLLATDIVVSTDTSVTTIPDLLGSVVPVTEDSVLTIQGYLDEANQAKTDAETAQAETEALFDDFDSSVADSMALVRADTPTLSIPFNESGRLDYGIGTEYVSGLPVYGVDFTRSSASTVINKSGELETLSTDEIGISSDGAWFHESYTVKPSYTNDLTTSDWNKISTTVSDSGSTWSGLTVYSVFDSSGSGFRNLRTLQDITAGDIIGVTVIASEGTGTQFKISIGSDADVLFDLSTGTYTEITAGYYTEMEALSDGFYKCFVSVAASISSTSYIIKAVEYQSTTVTSGDYVNVAYACFTNNLDPMPIYINEGAENTISSARCSVPVSGNLPNSSVTFIIDTSFISTFNSAFWLGISGGNGIYLESNASGLPRVISSYSSSIITKSDYILGTKMRFVVVIDVENSTTTLYADGEEVGSSSMTGWFDDINDTSLQIGARNSLYNLNSQVKNFKILPYAASADEVKSWGAPK